MTGYLNCLGIILGHNFRVLHARYITIYQFLKVFFVSYISI